MALSPEQRDVLLGLLRKLTPGHLSTLIASFDEPESLIGTSTGSANYAFLRQLCDWRLAKEVPVEIYLPAELRPALTSFSIHEDAKQEISQLLKQASD